MKYKRDFAEIFIETIDTPTKNKNKKFDGSKYSLCPIKYV
jgi:hypothetical protein